MVKQRNQNHMLLQFQVYGTTIGATPRTIGLTSAKGGNTTGDIAENPCCILCPVTDVSAYSSVFNDEVN
jgi:hypothetical protein